MKVIALTGQLQNGKNTVADILSESLKGNVATASFAFKLKQMSEHDFKILTEQINNFVDEFIKIVDGIFILKFFPFIKKKLKNKINEIKIDSDSFYEKKNIITRSILQIYGTNIMRNRVDDLYWVNKTVDYMKRIKNNTDYVLITDARFTNELEYLKKCFDDVVVVYIDKFNVDKSIELTHESENGLNDADFNFVIHNDGTIEELKEKVKKLNLGIKYV